MDAAAPPLARPTWLQDLTEIVRVASQERRRPGLDDVAQSLPDPFASKGRGSLAALPPGTKLPARPLLERLAATFASGPHQVGVDCDPALELPARELAAVGVIVCEAVANATRHAFPAGGRGHVWVRLALDRGRRRLTVRDSGLGIGDLPGEPTGGAWLIHALAQSLGGYARLGSAPFGGGLVTVVYPPTE